MPIKVDPMPVLASPIASSRRRALICDLPLPNFPKWIQKRPDEEEVHLKTIAVPPVPPSLVMDQKAVRNDVAEATFLKKWD